MHQLMVKRQAFEPHDDTGKEFKRIDEDPREDYANNTRLLKQFHKDKSDEALSQLISHNMGLVHKIAGRYVNYPSHNLDYDDLVSEGVFGLMEAIKRFDSSKGVRFSTYAYWWIHKRMETAIIKTGMTVRIPMDMINTVLKVKKAELPYVLKQEEVNVVALCNRLGISLAAYEQAKSVDRFFNIAPLDQNVSSEEDTELGNVISGETHFTAGGLSEDFADPSLLAERHDIENRLQQLLSKWLRPREKEVVLRRFGFFDDRPETLEEIGKTFGVTRERIYQIEQNAIKKLRKALKYEKTRDDWL